MKINVVKDQSGKVIATFEPSNGKGGHMEPVLPEGHKIEEMEVDANYRENLQKVYASAR